MTVALASSVEVEALRLRLDLHGYVHVPAAQSECRDALQRALGPVVHVEQVLADPHAVALVKSTRALPPHTDHHAARYILWTCLAQAERGGHSVLIDGLAVARALPRHHQDALQRVILAEHRVFDGDLDTHPMLVCGADRDRLYYSFWLAPDDLGGLEKEAFDAFTRALEVVPRVRLRLAPGDLLVVDNHRMLHGRGAIEGAQPRHLVRWWIGAPTG